MSALAVNLGPRFREDERGEGGLHLALAMEQAGGFQRVFGIRSRPIADLCYFRLDGLSTQRMGWASHYIERLRAGEAVQFRPRGGSMAGKIASGQLCTVEPVDPSCLSVGDIVLCKVNGNEYLHLVKAIQGPRFQIGNNRGGINGWITGNGIYGRCARIED